jgi:hypothetical protein
VNPINELFVDDPCTCHSFVAYRHGEPFNLDWMSWAGKEVHLWNGKPCFLMDEEYAVRLDIA